MAVIETDYLVVGAGASAMAFVDTLIAESDADVVMVERRHSPGGHWNDAYPFVRIHQASANYGVNSRNLGNNAIETVGANTGMYERATAGEICAYFQHVLEEVLLPSGQVRFFAMTDYAGDWTNDHSIISRLSGARTQIRVRKRIVDSTYLQVNVPATHTPTFSIEPDVHFIPVGELVNVAGDIGGYTILGGGKTAMDAVCWLLDQGEDPDRIRWIRPRDSWVADRMSLQPLTLVTETVHAFSTAVEALAQAKSHADLWRRLEATEQVHRFDTNVEPTLFRGAILNHGEREAAKQIERVHRLGRVRSLSTRRIELENGDLPTDRRQVHVDCTASGFRTAPEIPIFQPQRIVLQSLIGGFTTHNAALVAFIEASDRDDPEKNRLSPPMAQLELPIDWVRYVLAINKISALHGAEPDISEWNSTSRLNLTRGAGEYAHEPRMRAALERWQANAEAAVANGIKLIEAAGRHLGDGR